MDTRQLIQRLQQLEDEIKAIRQVRDVEFINELKRRTLGGFTLESDTTTGMIVSVRNVTDTGSEAAADDYDGGLLLTDSAGNQYRIGYYL